MELFEDGKFSCMELCDSYFLYMEVNQGCLRFFRKLNQTLKTNLVKITSR